MTSTTTVKQILSSKSNPRLISISPEKTTYEALQLMARHDIGAIAVMQSGKLVGILTERDYARKIVLHGKASRNTPVGETMNPNFCQVPVDANLDECMQLMSSARIRYVAVLDGDTFVGMISIGDVVKNVMASQQADIDHLKNYIGGV